MRVDKSVVLLSGGMDSATALFWALKNTDVKAAVHFAYNQRGHHFEWSQAYSLCDYVTEQKGPGCQPFELIERYLPLMEGSALTDDSQTLDPAAKRRDGLPLTFVPGRNLIFISHAAAIAYDLGANLIVGGWSSVDVDYPDCSAAFTYAAEHAVQLALGQQAGSDDQMIVFSPVITMSKEQTVRMGTRLGVPWALTRSCYSDGEVPCLACDSCRLRIAAFLEAGVRDPIVPEDEWDKAVVAYLKGTIEEE